jgi:hypothetical protein
VRVRLRRHSVPRFTDRGKEGTRIYVDEQELADRVLARLVRASMGDSGMRFIVTPSIDRSGAYRISYPGGRFNAQPEIIQELIDHKSIQVIEEKSGSLVIGVTIRGFDYYARHLKPD